MKAVIVLLILVCIFPIVRCSPAKRRQIEYDDDDIDTVSVCQDAEVACATSVFWKVLLGLLLLLLLLLLLGCIKGCLGFCCPIVGIWGLGLMTDRHPNICCYETKLSGHPVICDCHGLPLKSDTKDNTAHLYNRNTEFCLNMIFFLAYPIALCCKCCKCSRKEDKGLCVPGCEPEKCYGSQLEEEDVRFVLEQLKLSRDSLRRCTCDAVEQTPLLTDRNEKSMRDSDSQGYGNKCCADGQYPHQKCKEEMGQCCLDMNYTTSHSELSDDVDQYELLEQKQMQRLQYEQ